MNFFLFLWFMMVFVCKFVFMFNCLVDICKVRLIFLVVELNFKICKIIDVYRKLFFS